MKAIKRNKKVQAFEPGGLAAMSDAFGVLGSAGSAAATGTAIGGVPGAIVGGALGLGQGIAGLIGRNKQERALERQMVNNEMFQFSQNVSNNAMSNYYDQYDRPTFKDGGQVKTTEIYVNDGETLLYPDGTTKRIPKKGRKTDSVLIDVPVGTYVFGGLTEPITGKTYQELAENLYKPTKNNEKGIGSEGTKKVNRIIGKQLAISQEQEKTQQGVTQKFKSKNKDVPAAANGLSWADWVQLAPTAYNAMMALRPVEEEPLVTNPNSSAIISTLSNPYNRLLRRNINSINDAQNVARYNARTLGNNSGLIAAQNAAIALGTQRSINDLYNKVAQQTAAMAEHKATALDSLGQQTANAIQRRNDINARNRAAREAFAGETVQSIAGAASSINKRMQQAHYDNELLPYLKEYLSHGSTHELQPYGAKLAETMNTFVPPYSVINSTIKNNTSWPPYKFE